MSTRALIQENCDRSRLERATRRFYVHDIPAIPDCTHHRLVTLCGGDARGHIFAAAEHLLRMVANFQQGQLSLAIRFLFDPDASDGLQRRLSLQIALGVSDVVSEDTVRQLINSGPLSEFYDLKKPANARDSYDLPQRFPAICEVIRQEERVKPLIRKEENPGRIPELYYSISPLEARGDNDYALVDSLLSRMTQPCAVEMLVSPVEQSRDLEAQYKYITRLMSVNQYGEDSPPGIQAAGFLGEELPEQQVALPLARKRDPMADDIAREHQELHRTLRQPQLLFNVKAYAMSPENALMLASAVAESGLCNGKYRLLPYAHGGNQDALDWVETAHEDSRTMTVSGRAMYTAVWNDGLPRGYKGMARLCRLASVDELKGLARLPVGGLGSPRCIRKSTDPKGRMAASSSILIGDDMEGQEPPKREYGEPPRNLAELFSHNKPSLLEQRLSLGALTKHMFVAGVPGSGKTTAVFNILVQLARHGIPFLVIEPAKTEYRILKTLRQHKDPAVKALADQLRVYSPGNDDVSPFRFNPLAYPDGVTQDEHIGQAMACFEAAMPMDGPLQALIAEAVEEIYQGQAGGQFPQMTDLAKAAGAVLERKSYDGEVRSNLRAMIDVRLGLLTRRAMGRIFGCSASVPDTRELLKHPTIIEMDYLSQDHACLLTLFLLASVREEIRTDSRRRAKGLHHVTVIEEAHNIVGRSGPAKASEYNADPKAFAAQYVSRMLAELRALGEGIIIADQLPSAVAPEVVRNTGTKLAHRLVSNEDREDLGGAMLLGETEIEEIARLSTGEAYFYTEGLHRPRRVRCLNANNYLKLGDSPDNESIRSHLEGEAWYFRNRPQGTAALYGALRTAADEATRAIAQHTSTLPDLTKRVDDAFSAGRHDDVQAREARFHPLCHEAATYRLAIDTTLRTGDACIQLAKTQSHTAHNGFLRVMKRSIARWEQDLRQPLLDVIAEYRSLELRASLK